MANVLAVAEQRDGTLKRVSEEVVTAARKVADAIGGEVHVTIVGGAGVGDAAKALGTYGADRVRAVEHDELKAYQPSGYAKAVAEVAEGGDYFAVFFAATATGRDLAPRVAARLDVPLASEATGVDVDGGELVVTRPVYGGKAFAHVVFEASPRLVTLRANVFRPQEAAREATVEQVTASPDPSSWKVKVREVKASAGDKPDVAEAPMVVAGGRGMKGPENWNLLEDLADALGDRVALGASRAVVDAGWRPHAEQVGQTGKDRGAAAVCGRGDQRSHPAPGRDAHRQDHRRHQQGRRRAHFQGGRLRRRGRCVRRGSETDRGSPEGEGLTAHIVRYFGPLPPSRGVQRGPSTSVALQSMQLGALITRLPASSFSYTPAGHMWT